MGNGRRGPPILVRGEHLVAIPPLALDQEHMVHFLSLSLHYLHSLSFLVYAPKVDGANIALSSNVSTSPFESAQFLFCNNSILRSTETLNEQLKGGWVKQPEVVPFTNAFTFFQLLPVFYVHDLPY